MTGKKALWIFPNFLETINELPEKQRADVWKAVCEYGLGCEIDIKKLKTQQRMAVKMLLPLLKLRNTGGSIKQGETKNPTGKNQFSSVSDCNLKKSEDNPYPNPEDNGSDNNYPNPEDNPLYNRNKNKNWNRNKNLNENLNKNKNLNETKERKKVVSDNWYPNEETQRKLEEKGLDVKKTVEYFINQCKAKGIAYVDYNRAMLNWNFTEKHLQKEKRVGGFTDEDFLRSIYEGRR